MYTQKRISEFLKAANRDLGDGKYTGDQMIPDYCMAVNIGKQLQAQLLDLRGENEKLKEAFAQIDTEQLRILADWLDIQDFEAGRDSVEVQLSLRKWARIIDETLKADQ